VHRLGDHEELVLSIRTFPGSHKGELSFQTRPPLPYTFTAPESHGAPAYVVYKVGGDPVDYQFFNELPKGFHTGIHVHTYQIAATRYI
jgi:hypothetical protein